MIILDTNVVSEPLKPQVNRAVRDWLNRQSVDTLYLTTTALAELLVGLEIMPDGKRKSDFGAEIRNTVWQLFGPRILPFDQVAAENYARLIALARARGISIAVADGQIAAIALANNFAVATRDTLPFEAAGVKVINPWTERGGA